MGKNRWARGWHHLIVDSEAGQAGNDRPCAQRRFD
jgi:hypothetical protein